MMKKLVWGCKNKRNKKPPVDKKIHGWKMKKKRFENGFKEMSKFKNMSKDINFASKYQKCVKKER